jgi:SAM-dependent methyltransferase
VTGVFGSDYADAYDVLYADKDYPAECDLLEAAFRLAGRPVRSVLDLGCGTGRHSVELAGRGYDVVGVDLSEGMLERARSRLGGDPRLSVAFRQGDIQTIEIGRRFDAAVSMFAVLGYQISDAAVRSTLANVRRHLEPGGVFVFDVWYGPAVLALGPSERLKTVVLDGVEIERRAVGTLEEGGPVCSVNYALTRRRRDGAGSTVFETHRMRYFFPDELGTFLGEAGLEMKSLEAFPDVENPASESSWNVLVVATA